MRFDSARAAGLDEQRANMIHDGYEERLSSMEAAALHLTDEIIGLPGGFNRAAGPSALDHFSQPEAVELALGVGLFHGMSKVLIVLGLEPESMPVTVVATPGSHVLDADVSGGQTDTE